MEVLKAHGLRGLGKGREGVRVKAVLCILRRCQMDDDVGGHMACHFQLVAYKKGSNEDKRLAQIR